MADAIVVFNAGSTSLKFGAYALGPAAAVELLCTGQIDHMAERPHFTAKSAAGEAVDAPDVGPGPLDHRGAVRLVTDWLKVKLATSPIIAAGHRVVLGGSRYPAPVLLDAGALDYLDSLAAVEPSHQPYNVAGARAFAQAYPHLPQVACFDSAFHETMPEVAKTYALPRDVREAGARHWGYHGLSYDYISRQVPKLVPSARRVIAAHLGGGSSLCAMMDGRSVETTMGLGVLSGLPMATRSGDVPPEVLFFLLRTHGFDAASLEAMLYERSGLSGLSGAGGDMRELQASEAPGAVAAVDHFVYAMAKYVGAYVAVLGGLDALVFTGGVGEKSGQVRAALCERLAWLGVTMDTEANARNGPRISGAESRVSVWVIPTDEDLMIARYTAALI